MQGPAFFASQAFKPRLLGARCFSWAPCLGIRGILAFLRGPMQGQEYGQGREWNCYQSLDWHEGEEDHRKGPNSTQHNTVKALLDPHCILGARRWVLGSGHPLKPQHRSTLCSPVRADDHGQEFAFGSQTSWESISTTVPMPQCCHHVTFCSNSPLVPDLLQSREVLFTWETTFRRPGNFLLAR